MLKFYKKLSSLLLSMSFIIFATVANAADTESTLSLSAASAVLIEASSGNIVFEKSAYDKRSMASTTKIMTAIVALENSNMNKTVYISDKAVGVEGSSIYLYPNEQLSMEDLVYALMLESANDAATAIAVDISGSVDDFAVLMNKKASELNLVNSSFSNPHGLDCESHYTTAYDLAKLTAYALNNNEFKTIVSTYKRVIPLKNDEGSRLLINHNKMLKQYKDIIGVKTGYTMKSGRCLVSAAERNGVRLIAVTLNAPDDWDDHKKMLDYGFEKYENLYLTKAGEQAFIMPVIGGEINYIQCQNQNELYACVLKENQNITRVTEMKHFYYAPIEKGTEVGRVIYYNNGDIIGIAPIIADFDVPKIEYKKSLWDWISGLWKN